MLQQKHFTNDENGNNRYILVDSLKYGNMNIYLLNDNGLIQKTVISGISVVSYKIDVQLLSDGNLLISYVNNVKCNSSLNNCVRIQKFQLQSNNFQFESIGNQFTLPTDNNYISCAESLYYSNSLIVCQYVSYSCSETGFVLKSDFQNIQPFSIYNMNSGCSFDKVFLWTDNVFIFTFQKEKIIYFAAKGISSSYKVDEILDNYNSANLQDCQSNTMRVDSTKFNGTTFALSCVTNSENYGDIDIITLDLSQRKIERTKHFKTKYQYVDYPFISKFSGTFLSLFYHLKQYNSDSNEGNNWNVFEILFYPSCSDYTSQLIYINSKISGISLENYITEGSGEEPGTY